MCKSRRATSAQPSLTLHQINITDYQWACLPAVDPCRSTLLTYSHMYSNTHTQTHTTESVHFPTVIDSWGAEQSAQQPCCPWLALWSWWWWWWWLMVRNQLIHKINCRDSNRSVTYSFNPWLLTLVETTEIISVQSGDAIVLHSNLTEADLRVITDVRWTNLYLVVSLRSNVTVCSHGRCELLTDGSLRFNCVHAEDAGSYRLQGFDKHGKRVMTKDFLLQVDTGGTAHQADIIATATATHLSPPNHKSSTSNYQVNTSVLKAATLSQLQTVFLTACLSLPPCTFLSLSGEQQRPGPHVDLGLPHLVGVSFSYNLCYH